MSAPWSHERLEDLYGRALAYDNTCGLDRLSPATMKQSLDEHIDIISRKVGDGSYRFAPYLQILKVKGANQYPREISIPSARDRLVLLQLKNRLHEAMPDAVRRELPNTIVRRALESLEAASVNVDVCLRIDIKDFYPSLNHHSLLRKLPGTLSAEEKTLVERAIGTPSVPTGSRRLSVPRKRRRKGVPQGLAVSNILADLYLMDLDDEIRAASKAYYRFVDDILIIIPREDQNRVFGLLERHAVGLGLQVHPLQPQSSKGGVFELSERIEFLGYVFEENRITVRAASVDRFLENVSARVSRFRRERARILREVQWMTEKHVDQAFIEELNDAIAGVVSEARRFGWMFYFSAMNDEELLFRMDAAIADIVCRSPHFAGVRPPGLKRLARAYHEVRHRPGGPYVHNYNRYDTTPARLRFLVSRGQVAPDALLTSAQVDALFDRYRHRQLVDLEADVAAAS